MPPAASIFSRALAEKACAETVRATVSSPRPSTLTGSRVCLSRPAATSVAGVTSAPASKRSARSSRLTISFEVRNGPIGMDFFMCGPRSLPMRM